MVITRLSMLETKCGDVITSESMLQPKYSNNYRQRNVYFFVPRYILGPPDLKKPSDLGKIPRVHVQVDHQWTDCHLVVYQSLSASICILLSGTHAY